MSVADGRRIEVEQLSVLLRREQHRVRSLREYVVGRLQRLSLAAQWFEVLSSVSFEVKAGELFAITGANGAGKTTMLRVLAGIVPPSRGRVSVHGRLAPLIELGAGFDPELTGRENVFLYGTILGMPVTRIRTIYPAIVAFAELHAAMDVAVKNYSSGMIARLGFSVATAAEPDILLVDEVLAVGDESFRRRCFERIGELRKGGTAIVLVSHDLALIDREAERALCLERGSVIASGEARRVTECYRKTVAA